MLHLKILVHAAPVYHEQQLLDQEIANVAFLARKPPSEIRAEITALAQTTLHTHQTALAVIRNRYIHEANLNLRSLCRSINLLYCFSGLSHLNHGWSPIRRKIVRYWTKRSKQ